MKVNQNTKWNVVEEFLKRQDFPCHISEIAGYLKHTLPTANLMYNLKKDTRFIAPKPGFLGLRSKKYNMVAWANQNKGRLSTISDLTTEFLAKQDEPCGLDEIMNYVTAYRDCKAASILRMCQSDPQFITFGSHHIGLRAKNYDLTEWKKKNMATVGTLRDCVELFLTDRDMPCPADEIAEYLAQYRTFKKNRLAPHCRGDKRFIIFKPRFIGLRSKKYDLDHWKKQHKTVLGTIPDLAVEFLETQEMPCSKDEIARYILQYRKCSRESLVQYCATDKRMVTFRAGYLGLRGKKYNLNAWKRLHLAELGKMTDFVAEFLENQVMPCHKDEIAEAILKYRRYQADIITKHCGRDKRFITVRGGYVGLQGKEYDWDEWKEKKKRFRTMPDLAAEFLAGQDWPCHKDEVAKYVSKYRACKSHVLRGFCAKDKRFITIAPGYLGLKAKNYNLKEWKAQQFKVFASICDLAEQFVANYDHPCDGEEVAKYIRKFRLCKEVKHLVRSCAHDPRFITIKPSYIGLWAKNYNMEEWKAQHVTVFGSIADMAADFLSRSDALCSITLIARYIKKFSIAKSTTIAKRIRADRRFVFYTNGYVGLWGKEYDEKELGKHKVIRAAKVTDIIKQFMDMRKAACSIDDIVKYVNQYRISDPNWMLATLKEDMRFRVSNNGRIGLRKKSKS